MDSAPASGVSDSVSNGGGAPHVRRLRTLKRKKEEKENNRNQVKLERVLGLTVTSNASIATAPATGMYNRVDKFSRGGTFNRFNLSEINISPKMQDEIKN